LFLHFIPRSGSGDSPLATARASTVSRHFAFAPLALIFSD
jgi:hypothetical protein